MSSFDDAKHPISDSEGMLKEIESAYQESLSQERVSPQLLIWLPKFMDLNNESKHQRLTPQTRKESKELRISSGNVGMRLSGDTTIKISGIAQIRMGNAIMVGNQTISPDKPARILGPATQKVISWVSFHFTDNNEPVLPLLRNSLNGIESIVAKLSNM